MRVKDVLVRAYAYLSFIAGIVPLLILLYNVFVNALPSLTLEAIFDVPKGVPPGVKGGLLHAITGTLMLIALSVIWVYIGAGAGFFLVEREGSTLARVLRLCIDSLAWVPAVVWGLFGYIFFCLRLGLGFSALSGGLTLGLMSIPYVARYLSLIHI